MGPGVNAANIILDVPPIALRMPVPEPILLHRVPVEAVVVLRGVLWRQSVRQHVANPMMSVTMSGLHKNANGIHLGLADGDSNDGTGRRRSTNVTHSFPGPRPGCKIEIQPRRIWRRTGRRRHRRRRRGRRRLRRRRRWRRRRRRRRRRRIAQVRVASKEQVATGALALAVIRHLERRVHVPILCRKEDLHAAARLLIRQRQRVRWVVGARAVRKRREHAVVAVDSDR